MGLAAGRKPARSVPSSYDLPPALAGSSDPAADQWDLTIPLQQITATD
jgi:hypothetical protein